MKTEGFSLARIAFVAFLMLFGIASVFEALWAGPSPEAVYAVQLSGVVVAAEVALWGALAGWERSRGPRKRPRLKTMLLRAVFFAVAMAVFSVPVILLVDKVRSPFLALVIAVVLAPSFLYAVYMAFRLAARTDQQSAEGA